MGYIGSGPTRFNTADELTVTGDAEFNGNLTVKGTTTTIDSASVQTVDLGDNDRIRLGDGDDLQIYHDGSNSYVQDTGTGDIIIKGDNVRLQDSAGGNLLVADTNDAVQLYYGYNQKLATTATGVDVTGSIEVGDGHTIGDDANDNLTLTSSAGENIKFDSAGGTTLFFENGSEVARISSGNMGIGTSSPNVALQISSPSATLAIDDTTTSIPMLRFRDNGTTVGRVYFTGGDMRFDTNGTNEAMRIDSGGNVGIGTASPTSGRILDANGQVRFQASSSGRYFDFVNDSAASYLDVSHALNIRTGGASSLTTALTINSSGHQTQTGYTAYGTTAIGYVGDAANLLSGSASDFAIRGTANVTFGIGASEKARIDSSGNLLVGTTSTTPNPGVSLAPAGAVGIGNSGQGSGWGFIEFRRSATQIGGIIQSGTTGVSYNTSSDYRLKENVVADWDATTRLKQLNPVRFNFISDADTTVDGFLAHEVQDIVPEAISGTKDGMRDEKYEVSAATGDIYTPAIEAVLDEDGNEVTPAVAEVIHSTDVERPEEIAEGQQWRETTAAVMGTRSVPDYQGIDQSKLVPLLVKTIQELEARIVALETA